MIALLVDIVSKNGCMLLDVSPAADGTIPDQARTILLGMGDWLKINGEAVYGTRPWTIYGEGPTPAAKGRIQRTAQPVLHGPRHPVHTEQGQHGSLRHRAGLAWKRSQASDHNPEFPCLRRRHDRVDLHAGRAG